MRILVLCNKSPWPKREGGPIAMHAMISGLLEAGHSVKVLAANTNKYTVDKASIPSGFVEKTQIELIYIDLSLRITAGLYNMLLGKSYHISRFHTKAFEHKIQKVLQEHTYDIIQIETLQMATYLDVIRLYSKAKVVLRAHNIEHKIWQRIADNTANPIRKAYLKHLVRTLRKFEISTLNKVDGIVAITPIDARSIAELSHNPNIISIPFGINLATHPGNSIQLEEASLFHIGTMNWFPNEEGITWLLNEVWPVVSKALPKLKLHLAGRYMPEWLTKLSVNNVFVEGEVPDVWEYMQKYSVMAVPLFSGSGIRIKIVEAMAAGKAIITTDIGAEGINFVPGKHLLIANDAAAFSEAVIKLCNDKALRETLGHNARMLIAEDHDNAKLMIRLTEFYNGLV